MKSMNTTAFGIELECTGITRHKAATVAKKVLGGTVDYVGGYYNTYKLTAQDGREWKFTYDGSILCQRKAGDSTINASKEYSTEVVSPILTYQDDMETLQTLIRELRKAGAFANESCGIHIHLDGADHSPRSVKNFVNIIYSHEELFHKAFGILRTREPYCRPLEDELVKRINKVRLDDFSCLEDAWYEGYYGSRFEHYHRSRYHFVNLHSFFHGHGTIELRGFNSTLHAGEVRAFIAFALAVNWQALKQRCASTKKPQNENEKFAMRTFLNRIGLIGDEYKACRVHLTKNLSGCSAWRFGRTA